MKTGFSRFQIEHASCVSPWRWLSTAETCRSEDSILFIYALFTFRILVINRKKNRDEWKKISWFFRSLRYTMCWKHSSSDNYQVWLCSQPEVPRILLLNSVCLFVCVSYYKISQNLLLWKSTVTRSVFVGANKRFWRKFISKQSTLWIYRKTSRTSLHFVK